jgi:Cft2 family RNA processing exonuclease
LLGEFPVYIGGLSVKITEIYDRRAMTIRRLLPRLQLLEEVAPFVLNGQNIHEAPPRAGRLYALSSGMMTPKTLSNIFARRVIESPQHYIFFVGYADPKSPAGLLRTAKPGDLVTLDPEEPPQRLACHIDQFQFSAHASRESIVRYVKQLAPKKIVLVHGDVPAVEWTRAQLAMELPGSEVIVPTPGVELEL